MPEPQPSIMALVKLPHFTFCGRKFKGFTAANCGKLESFRKMKVINFIFPFLFFNFSI
jgi:hypothetical protein